MKGLVIVLVVLAIFQLLVEPGESITCAQVDTCLVPCLPYLMGAGNPTSFCCEGVKAIKGMASTTEQKQAACKCIKQAASLYTTLREDAAQALPTNCGVEMDVPISRTTDCDTID